MLKLNVPVVLVYIISINFNMTIIHGYNLVEYHKLFNICSVITKVLKYEIWTRFMTVRVPLS